MTKLTPEQIRELSIHFNGCDTGSMILMATNLLIGLAQRLNSCSFAMGGTRSSDNSASPMIYVQLKLEEETAHAN